MQRCYIRNKLLDVDVLAGLLILDRVGAVEYHRGRRLVPAHDIPASSRTFGYLRIPLFTSKGHYVAAQLCIAPFKIASLAQTSFSSLVKCSVCYHLADEEHSISVAQCPCAVCRQSSSRGLYESCYKASKLGNFECIKLEIPSLVETVVPRAIEAVVWVLLRLS
jgi:hypothetical protein